MGGARFCFPPGSPRGWQIPAYAIPVSATFWLVLFAMAEAVAVYPSLGRHIVFSPFGYLALFSMNAKDAFAWAIPLLLNLPLLAGLWFLIIRRYRSIGEGASRGG